MLASSMALTSRGRRASAISRVRGSRIDVVCVDGAAGVQGLQVVGEAADVDRLRQLVFLRGAVVGRDRYQVLTFKIPQARAVDFIDIAGAASDQFGGFLQRVMRAVTLTGQQQDQILLRAHPLKVLQLFLLGALVQLKGDLQA
jgi:hypothetical protein